MKEIRVRKTVQLLTWGLLLGCALLAPPDGSAAEAAPRLVPGQAFLLMNDVGHAFPEAQYLVVRAWLREAMQ